MLMLVLLSVLGLRGPDIDPKRARRNETVDSSMLHED